MEQFLGYGVFCFPFVTIGEQDKRLEPTLQINGTWIRNILFSVELSDNLVLGTDDGFLGVITNDKSFALKFLNVIFATGIIEGIHYPQLAIDSDLIQFSHNKQNNRIEIKNMSTRVRNVISFERDTSYYDRVNLVRRTFLSTSTVKEWITTGNDYFNKTEFVDDLLLIVDGYSLFLERSYQASFLYSWMLIETFLARIWENYVKTLDRTGNERDNLKNTRNWTAYHYIEVFSINGKISNKLREILSNLRAVRNGIIHGRKSITKDEAVMCLQLAVDIIWNQIHGNDPFDSLPIERNPPVE